MNGPLFFPPRGARTPSSPPTTPTEGGFEAEGTEARAPRPGPETLQLDPAAIGAMDEAELRQQVLAMLAALKRRSVAEIAAGAPHTDGTLAIGSMTAVWLLATVGKAFGRRLVRLSDVDRDTLRSVGGVARLIGTATSRSSDVGAA